MVHQSQNQNAQPEPQGELSHEVAQLRAEVKVLRESIDEFRDVVEWAVQNGRFGSMPQDDIDSLKHPQRSSHESLHDLIEPEPVEPNRPFQLDTSSLSETAKRDLGRLEYLTRIMPVRQECDHDQHYFHRLKEFFKSFDTELSYLQEQTSYGYPCEIAREIFSQSIGNVRTEMHCFEARQGELRHRELDLDGYQNSHFF